MIIGILDGERRLRVYQQKGNELVELGALLVATSDPERVAVVTSALATMAGAQASSNGHRPPQKAQKAQKAQEPQKAPARPGIAIARLDSISVRKAHERTLSLYADGDWYRPETGRDRSGSRVALRQGWLESRLEEGWQGGKGIGRRPVEYRITEAGRQRLSDVSQSKVGA